MTELGFETYFMDSVYYCDTTSSQPLISNAKGQVIFNILIDILINVSWYVN